MKAKKKFPDLTGDGKVTFADVLKGRGVKKAGKGMKYEHGGRKKSDPLKKKGPDTDKIKNNKANLEARKLNASGLLGDKYKKRYTAGVGRNMYADKKLQPMGYTPQPKPAPKPVNKIKGYRRVWDAKAGKYVNKVIASSTNSDANRARKYENKKAGKGMKYENGGKY